VRFFIEAGVAGVTAEPRRSSRGEQTARLELRALREGITLFVINADSGILFRLGRALRDP
jgi:hypothetical protein